MSSSSIWNYIPTNDASGVSRWFFIINTWDIRQLSKWDKGNGTFIVVELVIIRSVTITVSTRRGLTRQIIW